MAFLLAGLIAGQEEKLPSSRWSFKVLAFPLGECRVPLFLLGSATELTGAGIDGGVLFSVADVFLLVVICILLFGIIDAW